MDPTQAHQTDGASLLPDAEIRQMSILICDLVDSTKIVDRLALEAAGNVMTVFCETVTNVAARHKNRSDVSVDRTIGDSLLVGFGYPRAHEDDAERAVRAALDIVDEVSRLQTDPPIPLQVRIGIDTGLTIVPVSRPGCPLPNQEVKGRPPHVAHRLQANAAPGTVLMSDATRKLVRGLFHCESLGAQHLKGFADPVTAWRVVRERRVESRFRARHAATPLTPLTGRAQELALLQDRWQRACDGIGQTVLISGEPGIGKSRLVIALREQLKRTAGHALLLQCSSYHANSAFFPIIDAFQRTLRFSPELEAKPRFERMQRLAHDRFGRPPRDVGLLATLLSLPPGDRHEPLLMTPQRQKEETMRALIELGEAIARERPTLLVVEDAHWVDPSTLEVLAKLIGTIARFPMLLVITYRTGFDDSELSLPAVAKVALSRLRRLQRTSMITGVCRGQPLPQDIVDQIAMRSDGVPLFVEELTKAVLESLADAAPDAQRTPSTGRDVPVVPATLRDSLMARLDRLGPGKLVAQIGACIGRHFSRALLSAVTPVSTEQLDAALAGLNASGLTFELETPAGPLYTFKHALVQDVALDSLLQSDRRQLHLGIARALEAQSTESAPADSAVLAHHYTEAGLADVAVSWWKAAGGRAAMRSENLEAIHHLKQGIQVLASVPQSPERIREELDLQTMLGPVLVAAKGYADAEVSVTYARATELCQAIHDDLRQFAVLRAQFNVALLRAEYGAAKLLATRVMDIARLHDQPEFHLGGHLISGLIDLFTGHPEQANEHLQTSMSFFDPQRQAMHVLQHGILLGVTAGAYRARALWMLGYPDEALARCNETLEQARTPSISLSISQAMAMLAIVHQARGELELTRHWVHQASRHARDQGHVYWSALCGVLTGWLRAQDGHVDAGVMEISRNIASYQATGALLGRSWLLLLLAEAYQQGARYDEALAALAGALRHVESTGETYYAAEIYRRWGEILLAAGGSSAPVAAEGRLARSLEIAHTQGARGWELRTAMSFARLWHAQGKSREGIVLLNRVYGTFTEGFDTDDLREAAKLLGQLALA